MPKKLKKEKIIWRPATCEVCNLPFNEHSWVMDWSLSGEQTWTCAACQHENYPPINPQAGKTDEGHPAHLVGSERF